MTSDKKKLTKLKTGKLSRALNVFGLVAKGSQDLLSHKIKKQFSKYQNDFLPEDVLQKQIVNLTSKFGNLKGGLMKVGQMLSVYGEYFLPPEANKVLKDLQYKSTPFSWDALSKILKSELSSQVLDELEVDNNPIASASLGQVHLAKIKKTGERVALKIQYPNIDQAILSDISTFKNILDIAGLFPQISHMDLLFDEVQSMLRQELDYINEMTWTQKYKNSLKNFPFYIVPHVYPEYTSLKIITTSFESGTDVDSDEVKNLPQERRNQIALKVLELYFLELFQLGFVQTDPHIGNYKIRLDLSGNDKIILYDFGAVREFTPEFLINYRNLIRAALYKDQIKLQEASLALKFIYKDDPESLKNLFYEFCYLMVEPFSGQNYDWSKTDLPKRLSKMIGQVISEFHVRAPPREVVFLDRKTTGVFIFLSILGAQINARQLIEKYLDAKE